MFETSGDEVGDRGFPFAPRHSYDDHISSGIPVEMESDNSPEVVVEYPERRIESDE